MWMINCILLVIGTVAAVCGISFYFRNKEALGNIRFYILSCGICSAVWCICFGLFGICSDLSLCNIFRKGGDIGVVAFLVTEVFLVTEISGAKQEAVRCFKKLSAFAGLLDYIIFSQDHVDLFLRRVGYTTWVSNPEGSVNRAFHTGFILFIFLVLCSFGIVWIKNNKVKRLRKFLFLVFLANFIMLIFTMPDTYLPAIGKPAVSTSGLGAALCTIVLWYGATELGSFDIRTGKIKERLFDFIEAGVIVLDVDRKVSMMNRYAGTFAETVGVMGKKLESFFVLSGEEAEKAFESSENEVYTGRLWSRDKSKAYSVRLSAVKDKYKEIFCYLCVFVDVTEEVEAVKKFEIASNAKSSFLAQMSHEIRTPINAVLGMNEMILRESEDEEILEYASNIDSAGNTLLTLINSILDFSKIEDGKMEIVPVKYDTVSFINDLYQSIAQRADAKGLVFEMDIDETLPCVLKGDDVRVSQVIMNLLTNAVKYTEKGSVTFSMKVIEKRDKKASIAVSVKDTGIGIRDEDREKLFESFERLDKVRNHNIEGTGLGISIVTSLLTMMGSRLQVDSTYGKGSVFSFVIEQEIVDDLPIGDYEKRLKESKAHRDKGDVIYAPSARILMVDDNDMNLKVARNLLKLCGIKPKEAVSGKETIEYMKKETYDIVFLDHMMPGMDGIETLHRLKESGLVPEETVMIALTANAVVGARETYLKEGFDDYLSKPIEIKHLVEKLSVHLPKRAYQDTDEERMPEFVPAEEDGIMEFVPAGEDGIMEFVPAGEDGILEFVPDGEDGGTIYEDNGKKVDYDTDHLRKSGLDVDDGLMYCAGDESFYFEMLSDFVELYEKKLLETDRLYQDGNWHDYEVMVHALKSNVKMLGASSVYELAKDLEDAAKKADTGFIKEHHGRLISTVEDLVALIRSGEKAIL